MREESERLSHDYAILSQKLLQLAPQAGLYESLIPGLSFARRDDPERRENVLFPPCVGIVVQGSKQATIGTKELCYRRGQYILCCVDMPSAFIVSGSSEEPYLTVSFRLDFPLLAEIFRELDSHYINKAMALDDALGSGAGRSADAETPEDVLDREPADADFAEEELAGEDTFDEDREKDAPTFDDDADADECGEEMQCGLDSSLFHGSVECAMHVCEITPEMLNAFLRLIYLLDKDPDEVRAIAPLIVREIHYYLATGPNGRLLRTFLMTRTQSWQIVRAIAHMRRHCSERLPIESLARLVHMAESTFNRNFKRVTTLSPLQYHKHLKLFEARRLMKQKGMNAATACAAVGYESQQQFTREYKRLFGCPPMRDTRRNHHQ